MTATPRRFFSTIPVFTFFRSSVLIAAASAFGCAYTTPQSSTTASTDSGYVQSSRQVVRSGSGECVRTGYWEERHATQECDPEIVARNRPPEPERPPETAAAPAETKPAPQAEPADDAAQAEPETPPEPVRIVIGADAFFEFDKAELNERAQGALDRVAERANGAQDVEIRVSGHADQIGPEDYNRSLSERRAQAVREYLLQQGVRETAVRMDARGEGDPVVRCEGRHGETLIECLQPNRRTEIELSALEPVEER